MKRTNVFKLVYIIRELRKQGYSQDEIDHLLKARSSKKSVCSSFIYGTCQADLNTVQCFLKRCFKRRYSLKIYNIHELLASSCTNVIGNSSRKLEATVLTHCTLRCPKPKGPQIKKKSSQLPRINTERFKSSFLNRLSFKYN